MKALILGSTGYTGMMLMRILSSHPEITTIFPVSRSRAGQPIYSGDPGLADLPTAVFDQTGGCYVALDEVDPTSVDVVFSALPHGAAAPIIGPIVGSVPVIDLSADFRITDADLYESTYGAPHPHPSLLKQAVYGLTEWHRDEISRASLIACPGCYPTATLLPLLPFASLIEMPAVVNALSGISGAGRKESTNLLFNERSENTNPYNPGRVHRHVPEMLQELHQHAPHGDLLFTPHLIPMKQGMVVTSVAKLSGSLTQDQAEAILHETYNDSPSVQILADGLPETRWVRSTNRCDIAVRVHDEHLQLFSALDNLVKGAAGQGVANMNLRLGLPEVTGLRLRGEF